MGSPERASRPAPVARDAGQNWPWWASGKGGPLAFGPARGASGAGSPVWVAGHPRLLLRPDDLVEPGLDRHRAPVVGLELRRAVDAQIHAAGRGLDHAGVGCG